jgi:hypothetical protein
MARRKPTETEPLSNYQDLSKTGRTDILDQEIDNDQEEDDDQEATEDPCFASEPFFKERDYVPTSAKLKDGKCQYSFRQITGLNRGEEHKVKGALLIEDDLQSAVSKLGVHLAVIMDDFKLAGVDIESIGRLNNHELTLNYAIDGFEINGEADAETVTIIGSKRVSMGRIDVKSFKIPVDKYSSYKWYDELRNVVLVALKEVALYREGKGTPIQVEEEEDKKELKQTKLSFGSKETEQIAEEEFEGGRV